MRPDHPKTESLGGSMRPHSPTSIIQNTLSARRRPKNASHQSFGITRAQVRRPPSVSDCVLLFNVVMDKRELHQLRCRLTELWS
jgi:hypothetical protein